jgi:hypothetical protein
MQLQRESALVNTLVQQGGRRARMSSNRFSGFPSLTEKHTLENR